ncbi:MAG: pantoate--beta-alanine ligase [Candidatus Omnitrophota bacterium]
MSKIKTLPELKEIISKLKKEGKTIVFTNGCFDLLHPGHIKILKQAKKNADILIVGLNSDCSVRKIKDKGRPILDERARLQILQSIEFTDYILLFDEKTPYNIIKKLRPNILVKGKDWPENQVIGRELVDKVIGITLKKGYSTSKIIKKILKAYQMNKCLKNQNRY